ncbi:MAG: hypothetical protein A2621_02280 [Alphaproteobacteria bacterium RIFCSPHIGHO2_01_FULL_41_14]|nr:MAG: hypothetical protein A3K20_00390 [Alphaproteobacteria bacterium GWA1_45_9]OFW89711.1 MAG: hypothetical protein A2621_02280 [Alphaproteobacteria bacterium RIFCSPHIGHO2_01_FULL_41_14]HCI49156.1 hypothetical protein [Holosporales bacterium]
MTTLSQISTTKVAWFQKSLRSLLVGMVCFNASATSSLSQQQDYQEALKNPQTAVLNAPDTGIRGDLTPSNLKAWLKRARLLNVKLFSHPSCLTVTQTDTKGGSSTAHLFFVRYRPDCARDQPFKMAFIIKELPSKKAMREAVNLNVLQRSPYLRELGKVRNPSLPQMTFAEDFYRYYDARGQEKFIVLLHSAKGHSLVEYLRLGNNPQTIQAFKKLGEVLGHFQKRFMGGQNCLLTGGTDLGQCTTIVHGDFHPNNIFYDGKFIYFIDTETMAQSLENRKSFMDDAVRFYALPMYAWRKNSKLYFPLYKVFLEAYVGELSPDPNIRKQIRSAIIDKVRNEKNNPRYQWNRNARKQKPKRR